MAKTSKKSNVLRNAAIFVAIAALWLIVDQASKTFFNEFELSEKVGTGFLGLYDLQLVHNIGAAWGAFEGATVALIVLSIVVCAAIVFYLFFYAKNSSVLVTVGLSLVFAGGVGNAIDRITNGYVIDFISLNFIDFPVFNIADIGVTCGFVLFFIGYVLEWKSEKKLEQNKAEALDKISASEEEQMETENIQGKAGVK